MGAQNTIYNDLQYLYIDDDKAQVDKNVHYSRYGAYHHFSLSQGYPCHISPPLRYMVVNGNLFTQFYISGQAFYVPGKVTNARYKKKKENNIWQIPHLFGFDGFSGRIVLGKFVFRLFSSKNGNVDITFGV